MEKEVSVFQKKPISKALKTFFGIGDLGFQLMVFVGMYYLNFFLTDVAKLSLGMVALCSTLPSIFDFVLSPTYGAVIDMIKPMRWGRMRSWLIATPWLLLLLHPLQYTVIGTPTITAAIIVTCACLARPMQNIPWNANYAIVPLIASTQSDIVTLNSRRIFWSGLAQFIWAVGAVGTIAFFQKITGNAILGYTGLQFVCALAMVLGYYAHFKMTEDYEELPVRGKVSVDTKQTIKKEKASLKEILANLGRNPMLILFLIGDFGGQMATFIGTGMIAYIFKYVIGDTAMMTVMMTLTAIGTLIGSFIAPFISNKSSHRVLMLLGCFGAAIIGLSRAFVWSNAWVYVIVSFLTAIPTAFYTISKQSIYSDLSVYSEWKTGVDTRAFVIGMQTVPLKLGSLSRGIILAFGLGAIGYVAGMTPTPELKSGIITLGAVIPSLGFAFTGLVTLFGVRLSAEKVASMKDEISARKMQ